MKEKNNDLKLWLIICAVILGVIVLAGVISALCGANPIAMFEDIAGMSGWWLAGAAVLIAAGFAWLIVGVKKAAQSKTSRWGVKKLMVGAMCVALSFVLSMIVLFRMPQGGSVTPACMLPIIVFSYIYGWQYGLIAGTVLGILNLMFDPYVIHPIQLLLDYILGYAVIGLAGLYRKNLCLSVIIASVARWFCSVLSGVIFFAEYAGGQNVWLYSMGYNGTFMGLEAAICVVIVLIPQVSKMVEMLKKQYCERPKKTQEAKAA